MDIYGALKACSYKRDEEFCKGELGVVTKGQKLTHIDVSQVFFFFGFVSVQTAS